MAKLGNVAMMNKKREGENEVSYPFQSIHTFLLRKGQDSENTMITYERHIRDFFKTMRSKKLEDLTEEDVIFEKPQIKAYQVKLKEYGYKGATVNNAITSLKQCYEELEDDGFDVSASWFNLDRYDEHDSEKYDTLTHDEVNAIIDLVSKTREGKQKALLVRLAYATAFRKESLLTMKWNQLINKDGQWYAKVLGKGNVLSHKKLTADLYNTLMEYKAEVDRDNIFTLTPKTINKMMNYIRENMDFGDRHIVMHSLKKASLNEVNILTSGDIKAIQAQGDHKDVRTSFNSYIEDKKMEDLIAIDVNTHIPTEAFDELTREELLQLVKGMDRNTVIKMLNKLGAM